MWEWAQSLEIFSKAPASETCEEELVNPLEDSLAGPHSSHVLYPHGGRPSAIRWAAWQHSSFFTGPNPHPTGPSPSPLGPWGQSSSQQAGPRHAAFPALPDGVGDAPDTDAVGGLCPGLRLPFLPAAAPLRSGRPSARHPPVLGLRSLPPSLRLLAGCPRLPPPCLPPPPGRGSSPLSPGRRRSLPRRSPPTRGSA